MKYIIQRFSDPAYKTVVFMESVTIKNKKYLINKDTPQDRILNFVRFQEVI